MEPRWLDASPIPTVVVRDDVVVYANAAAGALAGEPPAAIVGRHSTDFIAPEEQERVLERRKRRLRGEPVPAAYQTELEFAGGRRVTVEIQVTLTGPDLVIQLLDVSARVAHWTRLSELATLGARLQLERSEVSIRQLLRDGLNRLGLSAFLLEPQGDRLRVVMAAATPDKDRRLAAVTGAPVDEVSGHWTDFGRRVWVEGAVFLDEIGPEVTQFGGAEAAARSREIGAATADLRGISLRIDAAGVPAAILAVQGEWLQQEDVPAFRLFGTQLAAALEAAQTIQAISSRNEELAARNQVSEASASAPDLSAFLAKAAAIVLNAVDGHGFATWTWDRERDELVLSHSIGETPAALSVGGRVAVGTSVAGAVLRSGVPRLVQIEDYPERIRSAVADMGFVTFASVPLRVRGGPVGVMNVAFRDRRDAPGARLDMLSGIAGVFAAAVETQRLLDDLRRRVSELSLLNAVAGAAANLELPAMLRSVLERVRETFAVDAVGAYLLEDDQLRLRASVGISEATAQAMASVPTEEVEPGVAVRNLAPFLIPSMAERDERSRYLNREERFETAAFVPVAVKGRPVGALVFARRTPRPFQPVELGTLTSVASQIGVAVENARLFAELRQRLEELSVVHEVGSATAASLDLSGVLKLGSEAVRRTVDATHCGVLLLDRERGVLRLGGHTGELPQEILDMALPVDAHSVAARVFEGRRPVWVQDAAADQGVSHRFAALTGVQSLVVAPLFVRDEPVGVVVVGDTRRQREFSEAQIDRVAAVANQLAVAIDNARLYSEARLRAEELAALLDVGRAVTSSLDLPAVLQIGTEAVRRLLDATHCAVLLLDREQGMLRMGGHAGEFPPRVTDMVLPLAAPSLSTRALRERRPLFSRDAAADPEVAQQYAVPFGTLSLIAAPLFVRDEPVGVVVAGDSRLHREFSQGETDRMVSVANQLAVAIDNARLYSEARLRAEELAVMLEVGRAVTASLDLGQVLETGAEAVRRLLGARHCLILLVDEEARRLKLGGCTRDIPEQVRKLSLPLDAPSITATAFRERRTLVVPDAARDPRVSRGLAEAVGTKSFLATPLFQRERPVGTVLVLETERTRDFTQAEIDRVTAVANQLTVAVENARLYEDLRRSYAELRQAQAQLVAQERLAALGELSAVVAHEVRNPLGVIFNSVGSLRRALKPEGDIRVLLDIVQEEADRLNRIVGDLLDFARPPPPAPEPQSLEEVLDEAVAAAVAESNGSIRVERAVEPALPPVTMDGHQMRQAFLNVAANAVQAMIRGGTLTVRAGREGPWVRVDVDDEGPGIPPEVRRRVFQPFFTTKPSGTGLGLAVVKRIVDAHRGEVGFENLPGRGTRFTIRLPLEGPAAGPPSAGG